VPDELSIGWKIPTGIWEATSIMRNGATGMRKTPIIMLEGINGMLDVPTDSLAAPT